MTTKDPRAALIERCEMLIKSFKDGALLVIQKAESDHFGLTDLGQQLNVLACSISFYLVEMPAKWALNRLTCR